MKSFLGRSPVQDLKLALGQYALYATFLEVTAPERKLYLAISEQVYADLFAQKAVQLLVERQRLPLIVVDVEEEVIRAWRE